MTRAELLDALVAERFGPLPTVLAERRQTVYERRRRDMVAAMTPDPVMAPGWLPPRVDVEIGADVAALAGRGWTAEQIAALLGVEVRRVRRLMPHREEP